MQSDVGPEGGTVEVLALAKVGAVIKDARWYFVPDSIGRINGDTTAPPPPDSAAAARTVASSASAGRMATSDVRQVGGALWQLPDGCVVGPGLYLVRNPSGAAASTRGADTRVSALADDGGAATAPQALANCDDLTTCVAGITRPSGSVLIVAEVNGELLSASVRVEGGGGTQPALLTLTCPPSTARGSSIECLTSTEPANAKLDISSWSFDSDEGGFAISRYSDIPSPKWAGEMVVSGTITVEATVNGQAVPPTTAHISVTARDWKDKPVRTHVYEELNGHLPIRPTTPHDLGDIHHGIDHSEAQVASVTKMIQDKGPNEGMTYLLDLPFQYDAKIHINTQALQRGSAFYYNHKDRRPDYGTACAQEDVVRAAGLARAHEGTTLQENSHSWFYVQTFNRVLKESNINAQIEPIVGFLGLRATEVNNRVVDAISPVDKQAKKESDKADANGTNNFTPGCSFNYF